MKRLLFIVLAMIATITSFAQQKDVTSFLGIPVDGTVLSMKQKLVSKGFVPKKFGDEEYLEGEFNGVMLMYISAPTITRYIESWLLIIILWMKPK